MRFQTRWLDVTYDRRFRQPSFDIAATPVVVLRALHAAISPRYALSSADLAVEAGRSVADVRVTATLFGGSGVIEVTPDGFKCTFANPLGPALQIAQDSVVLAFEALLSAMPSIALGVASITTRFFLELLDEPRDAHAYLQDLGTKTPPLITDETLGVESVPGVKVDLINSVEKWSFMFQLERAVRSRNELFAVCAGQYEMDGVFLSVEEQAKHFGKYAQESLSRVGLVAEIDGQ